MNYISDQRHLRFRNEQLCREIAERKRAEAELEKSISLLHATLESTPSGVIAFNCQGDTSSDQGSILSFNQKFLKMWGVPDAIIKSQHPKQLLAFCSNQLKDPETLTRPVQELHNQPDVEINGYSELRNGRIFEQHSKPLWLGEQIIGRVWSFLDITEYKRPEEELLEVIAARRQKHDALRQCHVNEFQQVPEPPDTDTATSSAARKSIFPPVSQLSEVFDFIEANYHQPITLSGVAQAVGYSPAYLTDLVRRQTGHPVNRWIVERRMAAACSFLLETDQSVEQIAVAVGYQNAGHFFRQFRQYHRTTPCAWRKAHQTQLSTK
jgi:AraC-like DNA-binding protein